MKIPKKQTSFMGKTILYGALALLCLVNIKNMWPFFLIFLVIAALNYWFYLRHKDDLSLSEIIKKTFGEDAEEEQDEYSKLSKKEKKKTFQDYLAKIENDFSDDYLDNIDADDDDEDDENDHGLYIR